MQFDLRERRRRRRRRRRRGERNEVRSNCRAVTAHLSGEEREKK